MPCDSEGCDYLTVRPVVTVIIDGRMQQFCGLSCAVTYLEDLSERHVGQRRRPSRSSASYENFRPRRLQYSPACPPPRW